MMIIFNVLFMVFIMFFIGNMIFISKHKHLLIMLMSLEYMVLSLFFFLLILLSYIDFDMYMLMVMLVFSVCEGALGLSILVSIIRTHGNDYFQSFSMLS
uniref:NADH-ubiquinone oxidoreductase chain 4L n=1 Tax=Alucita montana TaxID=1498831 RepID=A0A076E8N8_9NEOP|nr:NADH dehydrogenase subunit 4L [Alucita montana]